MISIITRPERCNGCGDCAEACAACKTGSTDITLARIRIFSDSRLDLHIPVVCRHCTDAPCIMACPKEAIKKDEKGILKTDLNLCVACRRCVYSCPFGALGFDDGKKHVLRCDLCTENPACVIACDQGALGITRVEAEHFFMARAAASMIRRR